MTFYPRAGTGRGVAGLFCLFLLSQSLLAQESPRSSVLGTVFLGPSGKTGFGKTTAAITVGGGGEWLLASGLGVGAEAHYLWETRSFTAGSSALSINATYHHGAGRRDNNWVPFGTMGFANSIPFEDGEAGFNYGGGITYWFRRSKGLRIEFRDYVHSDPFETFHSWQIRTGLTFR